MNFATALKAFLRQDPDVIMVGEIRDLETADIAIKAAQTGHLVMSTLHTNDAPTTLTRMLNMGVAPFNIAASVLLITAQRLARRLCENCKQPADYPRESLLRDDPEEHLIPNVLLAAMGVKPHLIVFGDDYQTPDGTCVRDYIHVEDLASAHLLAVRHLREGGHSRRYNLGNGKGYSNKQVIEAAEKVVGKSIPHVYEGRRPGDSPELVADSSRVQSEWGWKPKHPDLEEIVRHAWNWRLRHPDGFADQVN